MIIDKHALFPILLTEHEYPYSRQFKDVFFKDVYEHFNTTQSSLDSGYRLGCIEQYDLHLVEAFKPLYTFMQECVKEYLEQLHLDLESLDVYTTKSWLNIVKDSRIPHHGHGDAHLSTVYYLNIPEDINKPLQFHNYFERMEPFPGCIRYNNKNNEWDQFNAYTWSFTPYEGACVVFPGRMMHDSEVGYDQELKAISSFEEFKSFRISVAADYIITLNKHQGKSMSLQPVSNWRIFK